MSAASGSVVSEENTASANTEAAMALGNTQANYGPDENERLRVHPEAGRLSDYRRPKTMMPRCVNERGHAFRGLRAPR